MKQLVRPAGITISSRDLTIASGPVTSQLIRSPSVNH